MVEHPDATVETRLTKLAKQGLPNWPRRCPTKTWALTGAGRTVAMTDKPLIDDMDRLILAALVQTPMDREVGETCRRLRTDGAPEAQAPGRAWLGFRRPPHPGWSAGAR
jgi:hypothetical protein